MALENDLNKQLKKVLLIENFLLKQLKVFINNYAVFFSLSMKFLSICKGNQD